MRIAWAVLVGLFASAVGVGRLAMLGWLLGRVFRGDAPQSLLGPFAAVGAVMVVSLLA